MIQQCFFCAMKCQGLYLVSCDNKSLSKNFNLCSYSSCYVNLTFKFTKNIILAIAKKFYFGAAVKTVSGSLKGVIGPRLSVSSSNFNNKPYH